MATHSKNKKAQDVARSKHEKKSGTKTKSLRLFVEDIEKIKSLTKKKKISQADLVHQALALWHQHQADY